MPKKQPRTSRWRRPKRLVLRPLLLWRGPRGRDWKPSPGTKALFIRILSTGKEW